MKKKNFLNFPPINHKPSLSQMTSPRRQYFILVRNIYRQYIHKKITDVYWWQFLSTYINTHSSIKMYKYMYTYYNILYIVKKSPKNWFSFFPLTTFRRLCSFLSREIYFFFNFYLYNIINWEICRRKKRNYFWQISEFIFRRHLVYSIFSMERGSSIGKVCPRLEQNWVIFREINVPISSFFFFILGWFLWKIFIL